MSMILIGLVGFFAGVVMTFLGSTAFVYTQFDQYDEEDDDSR